MSLQDRLAGQDALQLLSIASGLSLATAANHPVWSYNLAIMSTHRILAASSAFSCCLFGIVAHEMTGSHEPLRQFISLAAFSAIFDILNVLSGSSSLFTTIFALIVLVLKAPICMTCLAILRDRGGEVRFGGLRGLPQMGGGGSGGGGGWMPSMPGGFGQQSGTGQQNSQNQASQGTFPSSGGFRLGGDENQPSSGGGGGGPPSAPAPGRNGYSSIA